MTRNTVESYFKALNRFIGKWHNEKGMGRFTLQDMNSAEYLYLEGISKRCDILRRKANGGRKKYLIDNHDGSRWIKMRNKGG